MKIKSFILGMLVLCFGVLAGAGLVVSLVGYRLYNIPYETFKWSAVLQKLVTRVGVTASDPASHPPRESTYFAIHTLENGKQVMETIDPYEWATREHKASPATAYVAQDGWVAKCGDHSITILHSDIAYSSVDSIDLAKPCVVGEKITGGRPLGTVVGTEDK